MTGVLEGFATIAIIIGVGMLLAQFKILDASSQQMLSRLTFFVASPALMVTVLGGADVSRLFSANLIASVAGVGVTAAIQIVVSLVIFRRSGGDTVIGTFCSSYVNAGNLGLPIAAYVMGDASVIAPMLLVQMLILQPVGLTVLDVLNASKREGVTRAQLVRTAMLRPFRNPLMIGSLIGVLLAVTDVQLPPVIFDPLQLIGGIAVPAVLIAYGVSLRTGPLPGRGENPAHLTVIVALKLIIQPVVAWAVGMLVLGLDGPGLLAVTVIAALPTAQNVFVFAVRYRTGTVLARDTIFLSTVLSVPVILVIAGLLS